MMAALILVVLGVLSLIALPVVFALAVAFLVIKVVLALVLLPFRMAGFIASGAAGAAALLVTGIFGAILFGALALLVLGVVIIPLLPALLIAGMIYLLYHLIRPARAVAA